MQKNQRIGLRDHLPAFVASAVVALVGLCLLALNFPPGQMLQRLSYDWSFDLFEPGDSPLSASDVMIIYMDEDSHLSLNQPFNEPWDRALHAQLLDRLTADGAKAVIFDIFFTDPGAAPATDEAFREAIRRSGKVILAADYSFSQPAADNDTVNSRIMRLVPPYEPFAQAAADWGFAQLKPEHDFVVREHLHGLSSQNLKSLTWAAASLLHLQITKDPRERFRERWLNYYGAPLSIPHVSYSHALSGVPEGFFRGKVVFIGARPISGFFIERRDEFRSPNGSWLDRNFLFMPSVEIHATILLNLIRGDWLVRWPPAAELAIVLAAGIGFGYGFMRVRPMTAFGLAVGSTLAFWSVCLVLFSYGRVWFPWLIVIIGQIPCALLLAIVYKSTDWYAQKRRMHLERQETEIRIREQAALLDKAHDAIVVQTLEGQITYWNRGAETLYGWAREELTPMKATQAPFQPVTPDFLVARHAVLKNKEWTGELSQRTKEGKAITVMSRWTLLSNEDGAPTSILQINTDITDKKHLEAQLLRTQRMESVGTLAGGIAHDLNNVLTPILIAVEVLRSRNEDEYSTTILKTIESSARRGADLVKQVLTFARGHEGERSILQVRHLIKEMEKIIRETFPKSIALTIDISPDLWPIHADPTQVHQVLMNLCVNARDAMPNGGEIVLTAENCTLSEAQARAFVDGKAGNYVKSSVVDTGTGIPPAVIDRIFEPFFTTKEPGKGTGLGLATVSSIVRNHGGIIHLNSEVDKGTEFAIYWPRAEIVALAGAPETNTERIAGRGETILIVDDEDPIRNLLKSTLLDHNYKVLAAIHGAEAISLFMQHKQEISLAIVDMMMPVMDGPTTIKTLKRLAPDLPVIGMSGLQEAKKLHDELKMPDVVFFSKPFSVHKLLKMLHDVLSRRTVPRDLNEGSPEPETPETARARP